MMRLTPRGYWLLAIAAAALFVLVSFVESA